jgi:hypothetical protein
MNVRTCFAVPPDALPVASSATFVKSEPRYTYITTPGNMPSVVPRT